VTTVTPSTLRGMTAVSRDSDVEKLGYIIWFSVPDEDVKLSKLRKAWGLAGLDPAPLPRDLKAVNAFKRAIRDQAGVHRDEIDGIVTETDVRDVLETQEEVMYQVSRVVRDLDEKVVEYPKALRVWFSKTTEELMFRPLGDIPRREVLPIMDAIQDAYDANSKTVTGAKVRTLVRQYVKNDSDERDNLVGLSGENMRGKGGGVYFVLAKHEEQLEALAEMLHQLYTPHGRAYLYMVPMADGATEREMIRRHHVMNSVNEAKEAMADVAKLLRDDRERGVRENVVKHHFRRLERLRSRAAQYSGALEEEQAELGVQMDMLQKQLRKLMSL
jgi:hypothetical protein